MDHFGMHHIHGTYNKNIICEHKNLVKCCYIKRQAYTPGSLQGRRESNNSMYCETPAVSRIFEFPDVPGMRVEFPEILQHIAGFTTKVRYAQVYVTE